MRLGNKILLIILVLLLLNLIREYIWVKPQEIKGTKPLPNFDFSIKKKEWDYYNSVFNRKRPVSISLSLVLRGTVISNPKKSFAIIEADGKQDLYELGDIVSGAKIVAMNRSKVVLDYNGSKQELIISEVMPWKCPETRHFQGQTLNKGVDFARLMTQLRIKPYFEGGRCVGFQLNNINGSIKQMGLQDGDIVESINGVRIDDPLKALEILYGNNSVHLGIERQDEKMELDCRLEG